MVSEKQCRKCYQVKSAKEFEIAEANKDGLHSYCRECHRAISRRWKDKNRDKIEAYKPRQRESAKRFRENHKELRRAESLVYAREYQKRPEVIERRAAYRDANRQKLRDMNNRRNAQLKIDVFNYYGGRCFCCGESDFRFLTIDHSKNDGAAWRKHFSGKISGGKFYKVIVELGYPDDLRLACWNCNCARQFNGGICPHESQGLRLVGEN